MKSGKRTVLNYSLVYFFSHFHRTAIGPIAGLLMAGLMINATDVGLIASAYFVAYGVSQLFAGILIDRLGSKRAVLYTFPLQIVGTILFAISPNLNVSVFSRILIGIGVSAIYIAGLSATATDVPREEYSTSIGLYTSAGLIGAVFGIAIPSLLALGGTDWRAAFLGVGVVSVFITFLFMLSAHPDAAPTRSTVTIIRDLPAVVSNRRIGALSLSMLLLYASWLAVNTWVSKYLYDVYGWTRSSAGLIVAVPLALQVLSTPLSGYLYDKTHRLGLIFSGGFLLTVVALVLLWFSTVFESVLLVVIGTLLTSVGFGVVILWVIIVRINYSGSNLALALSVTNMFIFIGGFIGPLIFGMILDLSPFQLVANERIYSLQAYLSGFSFCVLAGALGVLLTVGTWWGRRSAFPRIPL